MKKNLVKGLVVCVGLFFGSAAVAGVYEGITGKGEDKAVEQQVVEEKKVEEPVKEDTEVKEPKVVYHQNTEPTPKVFDPQEGVDFLQANFDNAAFEYDNIRFEVMYDEPSGLFVINEYCSDLSVQDMTTIQQAILLGTISYDDAAEIIHWDDLKDSINQAARDSKYGLRDIIYGKTTTISVLVNAGTDENHIYLSSLDGTIIYDCLSVQ